MPNHPALQPGRVALVTGAASGIGLAAARRFAGLGLKVVLCDVDASALDAAAAKVAAVSGEGGASVLAVPADVSRMDEVEALREAAVARFGAVSVLMANAGIEAGGRMFGSLETWRRILDVNFWGVVHAVHAVVPGMVESGEPGLVICTGSKQGITTPPGNTPYNASKAGLKVVAEALAHDLREREGCRVTAHLLIPGFVYTGLARACGVSEKPAGAWTPDELVDFMLPALGRGDFYVLCPDNDVARETDEKRIRWAADDIVLNRPALSRWDPRYTEAFAAYMRGE